MINRNAFLIAVCALFPNLASGATLKVPQGFSSIQAAIQASDHGDTIVISAGTYAEDVDVNGRFWLTFKGKGKVILDPPTGIGLTIDQSTGITLKNLRMVGGYFRVENSKNVVIRNCRVIGGSAGIRISDSNAVALLKNRLTDLNTTGIWVQDSTACNLTGNRIGNTNANTAIYLQGNGHSATGNRIQGVGTGIFVDGQAHLVANNRIKGSQNLALYVTGSYSTVLNNSIRDAQTGIRVLKLSYGVLGRNRIRKMSNRGIEFLESSGIVPYGLVVRKNRIEKVADAGIFTEASESDFLQNTLKNCGPFGFYVRGDDNDFSRNHARSQPGGFDLFNWIGANGNAYIDNDFLTTNL